MSLSRHRHCLLLARAFVFLSSALVFAKSADAPDLTYRSAVAEVRVTFSVTDEHNQPLHTLSQGDFAVVDNELVVRDFRSFSRSAVTKLEVVILVDSSESVLSHYRQGITDVVQLISQIQATSEDRISVLSFGAARTHLLCSGNCGRSFADQLLTLPAGGMTPLFDAVERAAELVAQHRDPELRPVLIVFSDGEDTISRTSFEDAVQKAMATDAVIYAVDVSDPAHPGNGARTLKAMANATGGRYFPIQAGATNVLEAVLDDLRSAYVVTYTLPDHTMGFHSVRILPTHNLNVRFRCRSGYYY